MSTGASSDPQNLVAREFVWDKWCVDKGVDMGVDKGVDKGVDRVLTRVLTGCLQGR